MCGLLAAISSPAGAQAPPTCDGLTATIWGDDGNNRIIGTSGRDVIHGLGGRDRIFGGGGRDVICGGDGADLIRGEKGADTLFGNDGKDRIVGGQGIDYIEGGRGNDRINGGFADDVIVSGAGDDFVQGFDGFDYCDFDRNDTYLTCEDGDVVGLSGFGSRTFAVDVPIDFAFHTYQDGGETIPSFVLDLYVGTADETSKIMIVEVLDTNDESLWFGAYDAFNVSEVATVGGIPATVKVTGLDANDFFDVTFRTHSNIPRFNSDASVFGIGSGIFKWKDPTPANATGEFILGPEFEGTTVESFVIGFGPGQPPTLEVDVTGVTDFTFFDGPATAGQTVYFVNAFEAAWDITVVP